MSLPAAHKGPPEEGGARRAMSRGLGPLLVDWHGADLLGCLRQVADAGEEAELLGEALGRTGSGFRARGSDPSLVGVEAMLVEDLKLAAGEEFAQSFARGVGWRLHWVLHRTVFQPWRAAGVISAAPDGVRQSFRQGYEEARIRGLLIKQP